MEVGAERLDEVQDCSHAVILLDKMGLCKFRSIVLIPFLLIDALTEVVTDNQNFSELLMLFLCAKMGPESVADAVFG